MAALAGLGGAMLAPVAGLACPGLEPCAVAGGDYYALPPPGWNGTSPLPAMLFFHGYGPSALEFARDPAFTAAFAAEGVLLVLPGSQGPGWGRGRDEIAFTDALRADLEHRFPVDTGRLLASGFSAGAVLTLQLACQRGRDYAGFVVIAGEFRAPVPATCPGGPVNLLQIHGASDEAVPLGGVVVNERVRLASVAEGLAALRRLDGCPDPAGRPVAGPAGQSCTDWGACASGRDLRYCQHAGGHLMPEGWVHEALVWLRGLPAAGP